jgi:glycosyltransferase involved in cell wall biosynthesis
MTVKVTAVLAVRNEAPYLRNCLRHLCANGVAFAIIDHQSTDNSAEIYGSSEFDAFRAGVWTMPFTGAFSLRAQLHRKMEVIDELETDWVIHLDADEMIHSYRDGERLVQAVERLAAQGFNVINCDEFVFLPVDNDYLDEADGFPPLHYYYFFEPAPHRLMRAWRKRDGFSPLDGGGHRLTGGGLELAPEHLALRHYMVLSQDHAFRKYADRHFSQNEVADGWHAQRVNQPVDAFRFPRSDQLEYLQDVTSRALDRRRPWAAHYWRKGV